MKGKSYEQRLKEVGLTTLEDRRVRGDMIETFKILKGFDCVDKEMFKFVGQTHSVNTRGSRASDLAHSRTHLDLRKYFFSNRVVNTWNGLPEDVRNSESVNEFKNSYDSFVEQRGN